MASINSLMSGGSSTSSIYGNKNVISGLATGMDTESLIETAVSGLKTKVAGLNQDLTRLEWQQTAYRGITDKLIDFSSKYLSSESSSNLLMASFFDSAVKVQVNGTHANSISVSGTSRSDFEILAATKAKNASYSGISDTVKDKLAEMKLAGKDYNSSLTMADLGITATTLTMGDKKIEVSGDTTIGSLLSKIGSEFGIDASFSTATGEFYLKSQKSGTAGDFALGGDLATALFGGKDKLEDGSDGITAAGENAKLKLKINGKDNAVELEENGNVFDIDGMKVTVKDTILEGSGTISFTQSVDSDKIVDAIKSMVAEFNSITGDIKTEYTTKPTKTSKGQIYKPLTEEQAKDMSDDAIKKYEESAKKGLLFADSDLSALHTEMINAVSAFDLSKIGITTVYENGKTTMVLDEKKLREAVENDMDTVKDVLHRDPKNGDQGGAMVALKKTLDKYVNTSSANMGILVKKAGTEKASWTLNENDFKKQMDDMQEQISRWETKLTNRVDYYSKQFATLEKMISNMNTQSSALSGFMGY